MEQNNNYKSYQEKLNGEQDRRIALIEEHIVIYNKEMGDVRKDMAEIKTDIAWLKHFFWIIVAASLGSLVASIFNLIVL